MSKLAGEIVVKRDSLTIDGIEFPWYITCDGVALSVSREEMPSVTVTIVADRVLVDDDMRSTVARNHAQGTGA